MQNIIETIHRLKEINSIYDLSNKELEEHLKEIQDARVCTPIIGKFSAGKSALFNSLLGYSRKLLKEDITPETAIPVEIYFNNTEDKVIIIDHNDNKRKITVQDYRESSFDAYQTKRVQMGLRNNFLEDIQDVMLVDMPGFESGCDIHNKAIDMYLPQSMCYLIAFPAEDMILRSSVGNILKELCLHDMPICIVITKCDKVEHNIIEANLHKLKMDLKRFIGEREVTFCFTSSFIGDVEELKRFLLNIQEESQSILEKRYRSYVVNAIATTENYLMTKIKNNDLTESELDEKLERLEQDINQVNNKLKGAGEQFESKIGECVIGIRGDVQRALQAAEGTLTTMLLNQQSINEQVNTIVRSIVTKSIQDRFMPLVDKYIKKVSECIKGEYLADVGVALHINTQNIGDNVVSKTVAFVAATVIAGPILGPILGALVAGVLSKMQNKKREEMKMQIRSQLNTEVFPNIINQVASNVEVELTKQVLLINKEIEKDVNGQKEVLEKSLVELKEQKADEMQKKENLIKDVERDIERIGELKNGI